MNRARLSYLVAGALVIAIVVLGWFGAISPQLQQASAAQDQISAVESQNQVLNQTLQSLKVQSQKLPQLTQKLQALRAQVPNASDVDTFVSEIQTLAQENGVDVTTLTVPEATAYPNAAAAAPAAAGSAATPAATASATPAPTPAPTALTAPAPSVGSSTDLQPSAALRANLYLINLSLSVSGPGPNIIAFVSALQTGTRLFLVTSFSVNTQAEGGLGTATIGGDVFIVATPQEIAAAAKAATETKKPTPTPTGTPATASPTSTATPAPTPTKK